MPLCTITLQAGTLSDAEKTTLAGEITSLHSEVSGVPKNWVHIVFHEYAAGNGLTAGVTAPTVGLTLLIRTGRPSEYKRYLLQRLWNLLQPATGAPNDQIVMGIQEVPASQAMEMGRIMPDVEVNA